MYVPCLVANNEAHINGKETWETELNGSTWKQKTFPYQVKCLQWIKEEFNYLSKEDKKFVLNYLDGTNINLILE